MSDPEVLKRTINFIGGVDDESVSYCLSAIKRLIIRDPESPIFMILTSSGGTADAAVSFYDTITKIWRPNLVVIGAGDISSAAVVIMSAGKARFFTKDTRVFLHNPAIVGDVSGDEVCLQTYNEGLRLIKERYQKVLVEVSHGKLTLDEVARLMEKNTYLTAKDACKKYGLADGIIG